MADLALTRGYPRSALTSNAKMHRVLHLDSEGPQLFHAVLLQPFDCRAWMGVQALLELCLHFLGDLR